MHGGVTNHDYVVVGGGSRGVCCRRPAGGGRAAHGAPARGRRPRPFAVHPCAGRAHATQGAVLRVPRRARPTCDGMNTTWLTGRVLGGGSSVNGLVWVRGNRADFDQWAELGAAGWDYESVLPYFRRGERFEGGGDEYRGADGPQWVSRGRTHHELSDAFVAAAQRAGHRSPPITTAHRRSASVGYRPLSAAASGTARPPRTWGCSAGGATSTSEPEHRPRGVVFEGRQAVGVRYLHRGVEHEARASERSS